MPYTVYNNKLMQSIKKKQGIQIPCPHESSEGQEVGIFLYLEKVPAVKGDTELTRTLLHAVRYFMDDGVRYFAFRCILSAKRRLAIYDDLKIDLEIAKDVADKIYEIAGQTPVHRAVDRKKAAFEKDLGDLGV